MSRSEQAAAGVIRGHGFVTWPADLGVRMIPPPQPAGVLRGIGFTMREADLNAAPSPAAP